MPHKLTPFLFGLGIISLGMSCATAKAPPLVEALRPRTVCSFDGSKLMINRTSGAGISSLIVDLSDAKVTAQCGDIAVTVHVSDRVTPQERHADDEKKHESDPLSLAVARALLTEESKQIDGLSKDGRRVLTLAQLSLTPSFYSFDQDNSLR